MANFESGVSGFVKAYAIVEVNFPIDWKGKKEIACKHCKYLSSNERMCLLNKEIVSYPMNYVGEECPLILIDEQGEKNV